MSKNDQNSSERDDSKDFTDTGISHFENPEEWENSGEVRSGETADSSFVEGLVEANLAGDVPNERSELSDLNLEACQEPDVSDIGDSFSENEDFTSEQYYARKFESQQTPNSGCGIPCIVGIVLSLTILLTFLGFLAHACSPQKLGESASNVFSRLIEEINKPGQREIFASVKVNSLKSEDKYIVASLNETLNQECKETRYGFTATYRIKARANFQYCVNLIDFKLGFENLSNNRMRVIADFGDLILNEPIAYEVDSQEISTRPFLVDSNKMQTEFMRDEFPKILISEGKEIKSMIAARHQAALSLEKLLRTTLLPQIGFDKNYIENNVEIKIEFGSELGENSEKMRAIEIKFE